GDGDIGYSPRVLFAHGLAWQPRQRSLHRELVAQRFADDVNQVRVRLRSAPPERQQWLDVFKSRPGAQRLGGTALDERVWIVQRGNHRLPERGLQAAPAGAGICG